MVNPERYTLTFGRDGTLSFRADCNSGSGPYTNTITHLRSGPAGGLRVEPLATTLAECGPGSRHTDMTNILAAVQDYELREVGHVLAFKWPAAGPPATWPLPVDLFRKIKAVPQP